MFAFLTDLPPLSILLLAVVCLIAILLIGRPMRVQIQKLKKFGFGIIDFELIHFRRYPVESILEAWDKALETDEDGRETRGIDVARVNLKLDFGFIPAYALLFASLTLLVSLYRAGLAQSIGLWLVLAPFVAGIFDVVENMYLLNILSAFKKNQKISPK